jgi:hypothetical protein
LTSGIKILRDVVSLYTVVKTVKEIQLLKTQTDNLRTQKKGLMQQLLSGKKRLI